MTRPSPGTVPIFAARPTPWCLFAPSPRKWDCPPRAAGVFGLALGLLLAAPGCGPSRPETVRVSGVVTIDGKAPAGPGLLYFHPIEAAKGFPTRPGNGAFDTTGHYTVKSFVEGDGLMPGRYQVSVECWESPPDMAGPPAKSRIAARYQSAVSSGLEEVLIEPGSSPREINFELSSR